MRLSPRARLSFLAHLFKCVARQDHKQFRPVFHRILDQDAVVLDVGGHGGQYCKLFAKLVPRGRVHTFEPGSYARSILTWVVRLHRLSNVTVHALGLGDRAAELELHVPIKRSGSVGYGLSHFGNLDGKRRYTSETVRQTTVDAFVREQDLERVDFIKADIEGWEGRLIEGAQGTLEVHKPVLFLELNERHLTRAGDTVEAIWDRLLDLGYSGYVMDAGAGALVPVGRGTSGDVCFLPKGLAADRACY